MEKQIYDLLTAVQNGEQSIGEAQSQLLLLFSVSGQSEQLKAFLDEIANDKTYILNDYYKNKAKRLSKSL